MGPYPCNFTVGKTSLIKSNPDANGKKMIAKFWQIDYVKIKMFHGKHQHSDIWYKHHDIIIIVSNLQMSPECMILTDSYRLRNINVLTYIKRCLTCSFKLNAN